MLGSDAVLRVLEEEGVEICFGMPGGAILPIYDAITRGTTVRHVLVRHEQGAGHMAQGYARASGKVGVVLATSGPGATNLVTPIADAQMDSTPLVCITGQVRSSALGSDAFQECDITGITIPVVKHSWLVSDADEIADVLRAAFLIARSGRPGPVLVDIPRDFQEASVNLRSCRVEVPGFAATCDVNSDAAVQVADMIAQASCPVLYVGGGAHGAAVEVRTLAEAARVPVVTTLLGKGAFPESHELFFGWPGMHGLKSANWALHHADLIVAAGARFDDRVTGRADAFAPRARVVHVDVDRYELDKVRHADIGVHGSLSRVLPQVTHALNGRCAESGAWLARLANWRGRFALRHGAQTDRLKPQRVVQRVVEAVAEQDDVVWTTGVGQHQMWAMQYVPVDTPRSFVTSGGHGTMGFGLPAAIGAKAARPEATVVCIDGDGSFQMTLQELATAVSAKLPVVVVVLNNGQLGMVYQWQTMFYAERLSEVDLTAEMPDLAAIARGFGALGFTVRTDDELDSALAEAMTTGRTAVLDVMVDRAEICFPMILPDGAPVEQMEWPGDAA